MKCPVKSCVCGIAMLLLETAAADPGYVSVGDYTGTANERINAAIAAAMATDHKTVFFPNGTYALRSGLSLNRGSNTEIHLLGESQEGVLVIPDIPYLEANYNGGDWQNGGARLAHMMNLDAPAVFASVNVSIQNMTIDMRHPLLIGVPQTYNVVGHGIRIGRGWTTGRFTVHQVTIRRPGRTPQGQHNAHPPQHRALRIGWHRYKGSERGRQPQSGHPRLARERDRIL